MAENESEFRPQLVGILKSFGAEERAAEAFLSVKVNVESIYDAVQTIGRLRQYTVFNASGNTRAGFVEEITQYMSGILPLRDQRGMYDLVMLRLRARLEEAVKQSQQNLQTRIAEKVITGDEAVRETSDAKAAVAAVEKYLASLVV